MTCCASTEYRCEEINGKCPECDEPTVDGDAYEQCSYSPKQCETCGWRPCDGSC